MAKKGMFPNLKFKFTVDGLDVVTKHEHRFAVPFPQPFQQIISFKPYKLVPLTYITSQNIPHKTERITIFRLLQFPAFKKHTTRSNICLPVMKAAVNWNIKLRNSNLDCEIFLTFTRSQL